jgi:hypothetical protein
MTSVSRFPEPTAPGRRRTTVQTKRAALGLVALVLAAAAACSSSSTPASRGAPPLVVAPTPTTKAYVAQTQQRDRATAAYAGRLAGRAPQAPGEKRLTTAPPHNLLQPDETIGADDLVVRHRYWTAPGNADAVYHALKHSAVAGLRLSGYGLPSSRAEDRPGRGFLSFELLDLPAYLEGGELYIELEPGLRGGTVVAAYSEVYAHPVRTADEHIPLPVSKVTPRWPRLATGHPDTFAKVAAHPLETVTPTQTTALVDDFNTSPVASSPDVCSGPLQAAGDQLDVSITSAGVRWELTYPGTSCEDLAVTRDEVQLPALAPDPAFRRLLEVLAHDAGYVAGQIIEIGGPAGAAPTPITGTATLRADGKLVAIAHTRDAQGHFVLDAQPGDYIAAASSIHYEIDGQPGKCAAEHPVVVRTDETTHANVYCQRR